MLRITKKERALINSMNARIRKKMKNLKTTFNIDTQFEITTPSKFLTRKEVNLYKEQAKKFLSPYTHNYVKLGLKRGSDYYFYVTREEYNELKKDIRRQNSYARRLMNKAEKITLQEGGDLGYQSVGNFIKQIRPTIERQGLRSPYAQFFPLRVQKSSIRSREHYDNLVKAVKGFHTSKAYKRINKQAQDNFMTALYNTFGSNAEPLIALLEQLSPTDFISFYESDVLVDFDYIYDISYAREVIRNVANGLVRWFSNSEEYLKAKYQKEQFLSDLEEVKQIASIDSALILSDYTPHTRTFVDKRTGYKYTGSFRQKELEAIDKGDITDAIIKKSKRIYPKNL